MNAFHSWHCTYQCCGSVTFWCGSGSGSASADPCLSLMDPDSNPDPDAIPDPAIFVMGLQDANKKLILEKSFVAFYFLKVHFTSFSKIKVKKK
jgi:hypothetical protein